MNIFADSVQMNLSKFQALTQDKEAWLAAFHGIQEFHTT